jgi:hypothetical protein
MSIATSAEIALEDVIAREGFAFVPAAGMKARLEATGSLADWQPFADSWNDLAQDTYMADGGRYRRRRHAVYTVKPDGTADRQSHQPHFQTQDYNALNGGIDRWFAPVTPTIGASRSLAAIIAYCARCFGALSPNVATWRVEVHQFRIEARTGEVGKPTPEGMHRDGVDHVLVLMIKRRNIRSGTTTIAELGKRPLGSFTLTEPLDAAIVDDARVYHGVTAVEPVDPAAPAYRDVLVVTFKKWAG